MNSFGRRLRIQLFGESHGEGVGAVVDGLPPGMPVDAARMQADLDARRPGTSRLVSQRHEPDRVRLLSGTYKGRATGAPLALWIANEDAQSGPYEAQGNVPRPGHADFTEHVWSRGHRDPRGGGHASGRLTAPLVAAGSLVGPLLAAHGIVVAAHLHQVGTVAGPSHAHGAAVMLERAAKSPLRTAHTDLEEAFAAAVDGARRDRDSVGGVVEFAAEGVPPALGSPFFGSMESTLAHLLFSVPAVHGVDFGTGFGAAALRGSQHNDPFTLAEGRVLPATNHAGGILGGRTTGAPLRGRVAVKPASSLPGRPQASVDLDRLEPRTLEVSGRHDPCIAIRAVAVVRAAVGLALADFALQAQQEGHLPVPTWSAADAAEASA